MLPHSRFFLPITSCCDSPSMGRLGDELGSSISVLRVSFIINPYPPDRLSSECTCMTEEVVLHPFLLGKSQTSIANYLYDDLEIYLLPLA